MFKASIIVPVFRFLPLFARDQNGLDYILTFLAQDMTILYLPVTILLLAHGPTVIVLVFLHGTQPGTLIIADGKFWKVDTTDC